MAHLGQLYDAADNLNQVYVDSLKNVPPAGMTLNTGDVKSVLDAAVAAKQQGIKTLPAQVAKNALHRAPRRPTRPSGVSSARRQSTTRA